MNQNFGDSLQEVLVHEGGWSDHPKDPGGATMKGVTLKVFREFYGDNQDKDDLRQISDQQLAYIYKSGYWDKCHCDDLPPGVDYAAFDAAVNSGPTRSAKWLQSAVGADPDGAIGDKTLARLNRYSAIQVVNQMCDQRLAFLQNLSTWSTFGEGWGRRVEEVRQQALKMSSRR